MRILPLILSLMALPAFAAPEAYRLNEETSVVGFTYSFQGNETQGRMPVQSAEMLLDLDNDLVPKTARYLDAERAKELPELP